MRRNELAWYSGEWRQASAWYPEQRRMPTTGSPNGAELASPLSNRRTFAPTLGSLLTFLGLATLGLYALTWTAVALSEADWQGGWERISPAPVPMSVAAPAPIRVSRWSSTLIEPRPERAQAALGSAVVEPLALAAEPSVAAALVEPSAPRVVRPARPAKGVVIPRIGVASEIVDVSVSRGEWPVPKFIVGHLKESANPGDMGNAVFAGHLLSLASGNVFARLGELEVGDELKFFSADGDRVFRVIQTQLVRNTDVSVLEPLPGKVTVTLITCEGKWLPLQQDYDQRRVVVAELRSDYRR